MSASMLSPHGDGRPSTIEVPGGLSPAVLRVLIANHGRFLAFLARRVKRRDVAEEILQDAFVRGIARGGALRDDESAIAWFYRLLRNAIVDHARGQSARRRRHAGAGRTR
jgi:DNA-directed RNA polymerase specialized sigma24 family protein